MSSSFIGTPNIRQFFYRTTVIETSKNTSIMIDTTEIETN